MIIGYYCSDKSRRKQLLSSVISFATLMEVNTLKNLIPERCRRFSALLVHLDGGKHEHEKQLLVDLKSNLPCLPIIISTDSADLCSALLALECQARFYWNLERDGSLALLLSDLEKVLRLKPQQAGRIAVVAQKSDPDRAVYGRRNAVARALLYIDEHLGQQLDGQTLARVLGIDTRAFLRLFRKSSGMGLRRYINQRRLKCAVSMLLESGHSVQYIAHDLGYSDASHFVNVFKKHMGTTPGGYREKHRIKGARQFGSEIIPW